LKVLTADPRRNLQPKKADFRRKSAENTYFSESRQESALILDHLEKAGTIAELHQGIFLEGSA
jgi:hypothetical protein